MLSIFKHFFFLVMYFYYIYKYNLKNRNWLEIKNQARRKHPHGVIYHFPLFLMLDTSCKLIVRSPRSLIRVKLFFWVGGTMVLCMSGRSCRCLVAVLSFCDVITCWWSLPRSINSLDTALWWYSIIPPSFISMLLYYGILLQRESSPHQLLDPLEA